MPRVDFKRMTLQEQFEYMLLKFVRNTHPYGTGEAKMRFKALLEWAAQRGVTLKRMSPDDLNTEFEIKPDASEPVIEQPEEKKPRANLLEELQGRE